MPTEMILERLKTYTLAGVVAPTHQEWIKESSYNEDDMGLTSLTLGDEQNGATLVTVSEVNLKSSHTCW